MTPLPRASVSGLRPKKRHWNAHPASYHGYEEALILAFTDQLQRLEERWYVETLVYQAIED